MCIGQTTFRGGGQNRLGAALMMIREELCREFELRDAAVESWPEGVARPEWAGGSECPQSDSSWQATVDEVAHYLRMHMPEDNTRS